MTIHWCRPNEAVSDIADPPRRPEPLPPEVLADALQDRVHPTSGRLIAAKRIAGREARLRALGFDDVPTEQRKANVAALSPAPCPVACATCTATSEAPIHTGWQWCDLREAWYCPKCGRTPLSEQEYERYVCGLRAGYGDALGGFVGPEILSSDPWFLRGMKRGRESAGKDRP